MESQHITLLGSTIMEMIIAILLWIGVMTSPGHYTQAQYDRMVQENEPTINQVLSDPELSNEVWATKGGEVPGVIIGEGF